MGMVGAARVLGLVEVHVLGGCLESSLLRRQCIVFASGSLLIRKMLLLWLVPARPFSDGGTYPW